jgi:peroxiredoxin
MESAMLALGTHAPGFSLPDVVTDKTVSLEDFRGKGPLVVMFICRHCPFVKHLERAIANLGREYSSRPISVVAICSNDAEAYPEDAPASLKQQARDLGFAFPYLFDGTQEVARAYNATCTPDFFLFDSSMRLIYRGQFDGSRPGNGVAVTGDDLRRAMEAALAGQPVVSEQKPSVGCNIKWRGH